MCLPPVYHSHYLPLASSTIFSSLTATTWTRTQANWRAGPLARVAEILRHWQHLPGTTCFSCCSLLPFPSSPNLGASLTCPFDEGRFHHTEQDSSFCKASVTANRTWCKNQHLQLRSRSGLVRSQGSWQDCRSQQAEENSFCLRC